MQPRFQERLPKGRREDSAVVLFEVDADDAAIFATWLGPAAFLAPGAVEGRRRATVLEGAARAAVGFEALERHGPVDAGFRASTSPLSVWFVVEERSGLSGS